MAIDFAVIFGTVVEQLTSAIAAIFPIAAGVMGTLLAINLGMKLFKRVTGKN